MLQLRDIEVLASVARYYTLTRGQINRLHFPTDADGGIPRKRLRLLPDDGLINRTNMQVVNPSMGAPAYVYYPSARGPASLPQEMKDEGYKPPCPHSPRFSPRDRTGPRRRTPGAGRRRSARARRAFTKSPATSAATSRSPTSR